MYVLTVRKPMVFSYKLYYLLRLLNTHPITIIDLMHVRNLNHYSNRSDLNRRDSKLQNFAHNFSNFKIIFELSIFESSVVSRILTFTFLCAMARRAPVRKIQHPYVKEFEATDIP